MRFRAFSAISATIGALVCAVFLVTIASAEAAPAFKDYPALERFSGKPRPVDFSSNATARTALDHRARQLLREEAAKGPNFAGAYRLVELGCGTGCQAIFVISVGTGHIYQLREGATFGVQIRADSRLIVVAADPVNKLPAKYFLFERAGFRAVR